MGFAYYIVQEPAGTSSEEGQIQGSLAVTIGHPPGCMIGTGIGGTHSANLRPTYAQNKALGVRRQSQNKTNISVPCINRRPE